MFDMTPIYEAIIPLFVTAVGVLGTWAIKRLVTYLGLKNDTEVRAYLERAMYSGIQFSINQLDLPDEVPVDKNKVAGMAAIYVLDNVPGALKHFKLTPEKVEELIKARL